MAVAVFGITSESVRAHCFPQADAWVASSRPSDATVTVAINEEAGRLQGRLLKESILAATVQASPLSAAYLMCSNQLRLLVAIRIARVLGAAPELVKEWTEATVEFFRLLEKDGATYLGDDTLTTTASDPDGPTSFIDELGLTTQDNADASTVVPNLRRDDVL